MIETISSSSVVLRKCPVLISRWVQPGEDADEFECGGDLEVICTIDIVGDDYGEWPLYSVGFACGHTPQQIADSIKHQAEV